MAKRPRCVCIIIDVQPLFIKERTESVVSSIKRLMKCTRFDLVVQTIWHNNSSSNFFKRLNYTKGIEKENPYLDIKTNNIVSRTGYSTITEEMKSILSKDDIIFICGLETDACVMATCLDLFSAGYNFYVVTDAIGSNDYEAHNTALYLMQRNFGHRSFIEVSNVQEKYWQDVFNKVSTDLE